jgi:hypothetical protein
MSSFNTDQSVKTEQQVDQPTFTVGDREYDVDAATKKITAADEHIAKLESERAQERERIAQLEAQLAQSTKLEEALQKLNAESVKDQPAQNTTGVDLESLTEKAKEAALAAIQEKETQAQTQAREAAEAENFKKVQDALVEIYGKDVDTAIVEKTGMSVETAMRMAKDPEQSVALLRLMEADKPKASLSPQGDINANSLERNAPKQDNMFANETKISSKVIMDKLLNQM